MALTQYRQTSYYNREGIGRLIETGYAAFTTTDTTGDLKLEMGLLRNLYLTPLQQSNNEVLSLDETINTADGGFVKDPGSRLYTVKRTSVTRAVTVPIGSVSATTSYTFMLPEAATITAVKFVTATNITPHDTDYWTFGLLNSTATLTPVDSAAASDVNTTKVGKLDPASYTAFSLTLGAAGQLAVAASDVFKLTITKASSATTMTECSLLVTYTPTPTSGLGFFYRAEGE